jgi:DNA-binding transcriptional ArsR family regulator
MAESADSNHRLLQALRHPFRRSLLRHFVEAPGKLSPKDLAEVTQEPLSNISYHVRVLFKFDALELVAERPAHGSVHHFYRASALVRGTPWVMASLDLLPGTGDTGKGK